MHTIEHLRELYVYNDWANRRIVRSLRENTGEQALAALAHILITEKEYFQRLCGKDSTGFDFWPKLSIEECSDLAKETAELFENMLARFDDEGLGLIARYYTSEGAPVENTFREVFTHVLLHSMNHRGQILTLLRQSGLTPPGLDYIIYCRTKK